MSETGTAHSQSAEIHSHLKSTTANAHTKLESLPISGELLSEELTLERYRQYLSVMRSVHHEAEEKLFPKLSSVIPDIDSRRKSHLLESDGIDYRPGVILDEDFSIGFSLGIMYVLEGSTLGGRYIIKNIEKTLGLTLSSGATYFAGYGDKTGSMWKSFLKNLQDYASANDSADEITRGALFGFEMIYDQLAKCDLQ